MNEMMMVNEERGMMETVAAQQYMSFNPQTPEEKSMLFNAVQNPDKRLSDIVGETIEIKHVLAEMVELPNEKTGEMNTAPRIVFIDPKGTSYVSVSVGIYNSVRKVFQVFGEPSTWDKPLKVKVKQINKADKRILTIEVLAK